MSSVFWVGLIVGLFAGAFLGFLFAAIFSSGKREITEESALGFLGPEEKSVSIKFVSNEIDDRIGTLQ